MSGKITRETIIQEADRLFYEQGFENTSFANIAEAVSISRGNFYHHFKSKDEILDSVIEARQNRTRATLERWEAEQTTPRERVRSFIHILIANQKKIKKYGCPVGTLSGELTKLNHPARSDANELFEIYRRWLRRQFELMGHKKDSDRLSMHILGRSQGVATLASAYRDESFIEFEVRQMCQWLKSLEN